MTPKPLTKEERDELDRLRVTMRGESGMIGRMQQALEQACAAEAFWREAVKKATVDSCDPECPFCVSSHLFDEGQMMIHEDDCAWLLAQDGE